MGNPLTVVHVLSAGERGGSERILATLLRHGRDVGIRGVVAALASGPFVDELEGRGEHVVRLGDAPRTRELHRLSAASREVATVAEQLGADIVQGNGERAGIVAALAARRSRRPSVLWLHDEPLRSAAAAAVEVVARIARPTAWVAGSAWMAQTCRRRLGIRVRCIPHGVDLDELPSTPLDVRALCGFDPEAAVVGHVGRLQRWKGAEVFVRAAGVVSSLHPQARYIVVGGALYGWELDYARSVRQLAGELGLAERLRFLGHRDDALAAMAACDVVVHASLRPEPLGLVVPEAMALGRAVVATRTRGPEEVIADGGDGLLVAPGDVAGMAEAIAGLLADDDRRASLGAAAAAKVRTDWSARCMAAGFARLYGELAPR